MPRVFKNFKKIKRERNFKKQPEIKNLVNKWANEVKKWFSKYEPQPGGGGAHF